MRDRFLLLSTLLPFVRNFHGEASINKMHNNIAYMKHEHAMHSHSSRYIPHIRTGKVIILIMLVGLRKKGIL